MSVYQKNMKMKRFDNSVRQNIGDPGSIKMRNVFPLNSVLSKLSQLPYGVKKTSFHGGKKNEIKAYKR